MGKTKPKDNVLESTDYSEPVQHLYLELFLSDPDTYSRCQSIFRSELFDQRLRNAAEFIQQYANEYKSMPDADIVNARCGTNFNPRALKQENYNWLVEEFERFSRHKSLERAIIDSSDLLEKGEYAPVERLIREAIQVSLQRDLGTDYWSDPRARLMKLKESNGQIKTGWPSLDMKLYGGWKRGNLDIFCAGSGGGKSLFLANQAINICEQGLNVIYFTFELSEELVGMRIDSMITGVAAKDIFKKIDDVELAVKVRQKSMGSLRIKYMPTGKTCNDLRSYIKEYHLNMGAYPDAIMVDYLDLMMPLSVKIDPTNLFVKDKYVSEELRNLAMEYNIVLITASQLNRTSVDEIEFDHSHISGGLSKIQTADNVIGIYTSKAMRDRGRYQIQFMKTRSSSGVGQKIDLDFDIETLRITDPEGAPEPSLNDLKSNAYTNVDKSSVVNNSTSSQVINDFRKTSTVRASTVKIASSADDKKSTGNTSSPASQLRNLLSSINPEKD